MLEFIFRSFWTFAGTCTLIMIAAFGVSLIIETIGVAIYNTRIGSRKNTSTKSDADK